MKKPAIYNPTCTHTIERFKKKNIIAFVVDEENEFRSKEKAKLYNLLNEMNTDFKVYNFSESLIKGALALLNIDVQDFLKDRKKYSQYLKDLANFHKKQDANHFVSNWIEDNYFRDNIIITDVKFIEQYRFLYDCNALIVKVNSFKETRNFNQTLIKNLKFNYEIGVHNLIHKKIINDLMIYSRKLTSKQPIDRWADFKNFQEKEYKNNLITDLTKVVKKKRKRI